MEKRTTYNPVWSWNECEYRVKPEPKEPTYRPYANFDEFRAEWEKHGGWIYNKETNSHHLLSSMNEPQYFCEKYVWADDGTPCGIKIEE